MLPEPDVLERATGPTRVALGCARLSMSRWAPDERVAMATIHAALDAGVRLLDTADSYGDTLADAGANERLVARALATWGGDADDVLVATKGGRWRSDDGTWRRDASPQALRRACDASLRALGVERIGLYHLHSADPEVPLAESLGLLDELRREGRIARIGVSNLSTEELGVARATVDVACLQNQLAPGALDHLALAVGCPVPFFAWAPLEGVRTDEEAQRVPAFSAEAKANGVTPRQLALAWLRTLGDHITPIIGPVDPAELRESLAAPMTLTAPTMAMLPALRDRRRA